MHIDWWTLGLQTINLLVLVWILSRFLFRPIARIIDERQAAAAKLIEEADAARAKAEEEEKQAAKEEAEAAAARGGVLKSAAEEAEAEKARLIAAARDEADKLRAEAKAEIARMRESEEAASGARASRLAVDIAARLFDRLPESARIGGFVDGLAQAIAELPEAARAEIGASDAPVAVKAARALTAEEAEACRAAISKALGRDVAIEAVAAPDLIAGLEIETPHAVVRNNFRADLDRIAEGLTSDEPAGT
jgi:F-type H+-transporting ATPase subunit b